MKRTALRPILDRLSVLLEVPPEEASARPDPRGRLAVGPYTFAVESRGSAATPVVHGAVEQLGRRVLNMGKTTIPLVAVPYMGEAGRRICEEAHISWLDLSGNAHIVAPRLRILIQGQPNRFKVKGRPSSVFAPKSARIARWLLMHPDEPITQRALAQATDMDEGFTSRLVARLEADQLVTRLADGKIQPGDPGLLLDAWRDIYDFSKHQILRGHVPARSGEALLRRLADSLREQEEPYAATGLAGAWLLTRFAGFRIATVYLPEHPSSVCQGRLWFREDPQGANTWLVVPNDAGVFHGAAEHGGIRCVHPVQAYLDLGGHPERAAEAAEQLRAELLRWPSHA